MMSTMTPMGVMTEEMMSTMAEMASMKRSQRMSGLMYDRRRKTSATSKDVLAAGAMLLETVL